MNPREGTHTYSALGQVQSVIEEWIVDHATVGIDPSPVPKGQHLDQQYSNEGQDDEVDIVDQFIAGENIAREKRQTEETANEQPSISFPRLLSRLSEIRLEVFQCGENRVPCRTDPSILRTAR